MRAQEDVGSLLILHGGVRWWHLTHDDLSKYMYKLHPCKLSGKKVFSVLDKKDGFWQVSLNQETSFLCTFNSPFGHHCFLRRLFGTSSAPEVFQKCND